ncbi:pectinesterase/pectinesterase inhibitor PPE8B-like [Arachis stenosperma]|uniref:pectinesterase/pectinesterase inhibitor PPE8B-like n=1 Tax=Arachis stenosperma TaxID=217475 RepID=UPI0025ACB422|nr:pectinesterase/pectinesterase inhibitor PPE8B-like [Arachis stenosperma]
MALASRKMPLLRTPTSSFTITSSVLFFLVAVAFLGGADGGAYFAGSECLKVTPSEFVVSVRDVVDVMQGIMSILAEFDNGGFGDDFRVSNAVSDCVDLLDLSSDELDWSVSATQNPQGKHNSTGNLSSDLRTWLSATLANPETCMDGFEGTNSMVKGLVSTGLVQMISLVQNLLTQVDPVPDHSFSTKQGKFPAWVKPRDRKKLLEANNNGVGVFADAVVAADGTGNYTKIMDAVKDAPNYSMSRYVIYIKKGVYNENVEIKKKKWNLMIIGDGMNNTVITGNRSFVDGWTTFRSATFAVSGRGFIARDVAFQNTAGPAKHQAVALRSDSDLSVYYRCGIFGYQDSLYAHTMRQFYRECKITGTVDFIFGDATAIFQNCQILAKKGLPDQKNTITAHGRKEPTEPTGFSIQFSNITADSDLVPLINTTHTYLGRPWKPYSRTIVMQSFISDVLRPEGWLEWSGNVSLDTLYYAEYMNHGPGSGLSNRVKWPGYHVMNDSSQASNFTVTQFIEGNLWLPSTGVVFTAGLGV